MFFQTFRFSSGWSVGGCACPFIRGNHGEQLCREVGRSFTCPGRNGFSGTVLTDRFSAAVLILQNTPDMGYRLAGRLSRPDAGHASPALEWHWLMRQGIREFPWQFPERHRHGFHRSFPRSTLWTGIRILFTFHVLYSGEPCPSGAGLAFRGRSRAKLTGCLMLPAGGAGDNLGDNADYMVDLTETSPKPLVEHVNLEPEELELLFWGCPVMDFSGMSRVNISFWKTIATNLSTVFRSIPGISNQFGLSGANLSVKALSRTSILAVVW